MYFVCQEASELSSLKPQLDDSGVALYAVVKENIGTEIQDFRRYFNGEIFLDEKVIQEQFGSLMSEYRDVYRFLRCSRRVSTVRSGGR